MPAIATHAVASKEIIFLSPPRCTLGHRPSASRMYVARPGDEKRPEPGVIPSRERFFFVAGTGFEPVTSGL